MFTIGGPRRTTCCDGVSRREFLRLGALGLGGLTLADLARARGEGKAASSSTKSVIMIYLFGGMSQLDMYDMKPEAPAEYRGEFKPIQTNVPGFHICEHMPKQATIADKLAIIRNWEVGPKQVRKRFLTWRTSLPTTMAA
jgi:hypothetical protein